MNKKIAAGVLVAVALMATGCSEVQKYDDTRGKGDAAVNDGYGHRKGNDNPKLVTNMPDGYANIATSCVAPGFRAFVTTHTDMTGIPVIVVDEKCNQYSDVANLYKG